MHTPDGYLNHATEIGTALLAVGALSLSIAHAPREFTAARGPAYIGGVAAAVFAGQMMNFPVAGGTSGHLMGGVLAAVLVGPWTAMVCMAAILTVQALVFADGGIAAAGANYLLMGAVAIASGWLVFRCLGRLLPARGRGVALAAGAGAFVSVPTASLAFSLLHAVGPGAPADPWQTAQAMLGWHLLIGVGEAAITTLAVISLHAWRSGLVRGPAGEMSPGRLSRVPA